MDKQMTDLDKKRDKAAIECAKDCGLTITTDSAQQLITGYQLGWDAAVKELADRDACYEARKEWDDLLKERDAYIAQCEKLASALNWYWENWGASDQGIKHKGYGVAEKTLIDYANFKKEMDNE